MVSDLMYFVLMGVVTAKFLALVYFLWDLVFNVKLPNMEGKHIVITGGSSGIGKAVGVAAASLGADITLLARSNAKLEESRKFISGYCVKASQRISVFSCDVTQPLEQTERLFSKIEEEISPIFMLVNCAGAAECATIADATEENFRRMIDLNLLGTVLVTKAALKGMMSRREGIVVITASQAALLGIYGMGAYCSSKWALRGFAETLNQEVAPYNISVTLCLPPDTDTPGFENENKDKPDETKQICQAGGLFSPDDVAQKLISDAMKGRFWSTVGFEGVLLTLGCAGFSPLSSIAEVFSQVAFASIVRILSIFHLRNINTVIAGMHLMKTDQEVKKQE